MQSTTAASNSYCHPQTSSYFYNDPIIKIFVACVLNISITAYQFSKRNIKHLKYSQLLALSFTVTNPLIPALTLILTAAFIGTVALKLLNKKNRSWSRACDAVSQFSIINTLSLSYLTFYVHELGHATLSASFFKTPRVAIKIIPFSGGETSYAISYGLTKIGSFFGKDRALLLIAAGGFLASTATCLILTQISKSIRQSNPLSSKFLQHLALSQILTELIHAVSSLIEKEPDYQNDFTYLMHAGSIHPLIPVSIMAASCLYSIYSVQLL